MQVNNPLSIFLVLILCLVAAISAFYFKNKSCIDKLDDSYPSSYTRSGWITDIGTDSNSFKLYGVEYLMIENKYGNLSNQITIGKSTTIKKQDNSDITIKDLSMGDFIVVIPDGMIKDISPAKLSAKSITLVQKHQLFCTPISLTKLLPNH